MKNTVFKVFIAQLLRGKLLALINILGLAAGLMCSLLIALFVSHELRYDSFFRQTDDTHRISVELGFPDGSQFKLSSAPGPIAPLLEEHVPQVLMATRMVTRRTVLRNGESLVTEDEFNLVDRNFFSVFDLVWLQGNPEQALDSPDALVLTTSMARRYFGEADPLGEILPLQDDEKEILLRVTGVIDDLPSNTHLSGLAFASMDVLQMLENPVDLTTWWGNSDAYTYVVLEPVANVANFDAILAGLVEQYASGPPVPGLETTLHRLPLKDIHMHSSNINELRPGGNQLVVYTLIAIAFAILIVACINFVNITTAWATRRGKEVGVRKMLGASRTELMLQFIIEVCLLCGLAMLLALASVELLLPTFNAWLGMDLRAGMGRVVTVGMGLLLATMVLGLLAGWYPSLYLSAMKPAVVLKGSSPAGYTGVVFRGVLVMLQFAVVIMLLVSAVVMQLQLRHISRLDMGFQQEQVVRINASGVNMQEGYAAFREEVLRSDAVLSMSSSSSSPLRDAGTISESVMQGEGEDLPKRVVTMQVDYDYFTTYGIPVLAGRVFSRDQPSDSSSMDGIFAGAVVINERAAREFGWEAENALGKTLQPLGAETWFSVLGVIADTVEHARQEARPVVYTMPGAPMAGEIITVRIREGRTAEALTHIDTQWQVFNPDRPIQRVFLDDTVEALYLQDTRQLELSFLFSGLSILIACLGLYGLVAYSTQCRSKEIGVRKVMGGSVWSIVLLLTNDFSKLVLISNLIAWPLAYIAMNQWLENFAYRIDLTPMIFIGSGLIALCIAWVTVGGTAAKAASAKPVLALRYE